MSASTLITQAAEEASARKRSWSQTWTRTDTARWLDDRSPAVATHYSTVHGIRFTRQPRQVGGWLQRNRPKAFDELHRRLTAAGAHRETIALAAVLT